MKKPKILIYDIETSPNLAYVWGKYQQDVIDYKSEWQLLCFAWKWLGEKKVSAHSRLGTKDATDKSLVKKLWALLNEADVIITHNGLDFDNKKANAKFIEHGLSPIKPSQQIDTKRVAKQNFKFNSNKLDDLGKLLGVGRKMKHQGFDMWLGCMAGEKKAFADMVRYNKQDVLLLERVYLKLRPWINNHPNLVQLEGRPEGCPKCGSEKLKSHGIKYLKTSTYRQYLCLNCGGYCRGESLKAVKPKFVAL